VNLTDTALDALLLQLSQEGFTLPHMARSADYVDPASTGEARRAQLAALQAADDSAWDRNRAALRAALEAVQA
jgi:hypothetical protein